MLISQNQELQMLGLPRLQSTSACSADLFSTVYFIPLFLSPSVFGWIEIEMKNQVDLPSTYTIPSAPRLRCGNPQALHSSNRLAITCAVSFQPLISPAFFNSF